MILFILKILARIPLPVLHLGAWPLGLLLIIIPNKQRHYARINVRICLPQLSFRQRQWIWMRSLIETVKTLLESPKLWLGKQRKVLQLIRKVDGLEAVKQAREKGKGVIFIAPHLGNWEIIGQFYSYNFPMVLMYRPQKNPELDDIIRKGRERFDAQLVPSTRKGLAILLKSLRENKTIGILPDQNPGAGAGVYVPFFGISANTPIFATRLASRTHAAAFIVTAERLAFGRGYHLHIEAASKCLYDRNVETGAACMNRDMEKIILRRPEQYWWSYNRFRHRPEGEPEIY
ncbi:Lipid A biosynthesis lauroyl acyltransferase [hydrothermal vent metagenome]|uniref:Lipid A biosynthesis lauroyl acyltransferase n=1 Tax=hydrothermal vent metagenome TaxID=652676 RepID=A0A3B1BDM8_9ZZZZ